METIALVTGANKGIGFEVCRQLGKKGMLILVGARDKDRGETAASKLRDEQIKAQFVQLDVCSEQSVAAAAVEIGSKFGKLDVLINNAGTSLKGRDGLPSSVSLQTYRDTFDINFFGLISVTNAMLPLLKKSEAPRIVNLSSILGSHAEHADPNSTIYNTKYTAYDASKAAVNMFTSHLAHEMRESKMKVNAAHPGWVKTDLGGDMAPLEVDVGAKTAVSLATIGPEGPSGGFYHLGTHLRW